MSLAERIIPDKKMDLAERLAITLRKSLEKGELSASPYLPSSRELARRYSTSIPTMQKALQKLRDRDVIHLHSKRRGFVRNAVSGERKRVLVKQIVVLLGKSPKERVETCGFRANQVNLGTDSWGGQILHSAMDYLSGQGYNCTVFYYDQSGQEGLKSVISYLERNNPEACFFIADECLLSLPQQLDDRNIRWVSLNCTPCAENNFIMADNVVGGRIVGEYFLRCGFRKVLYVSHGLTSINSSAMERLTGFLQVFIKAGIPLGNISTLICESGQEAQSQKAVADFLKGNGPPDAIFCSGDFLALGAVHACQNNGCDIPGQVSIVGGTGLDCVASYQPRLAVLAQPMAKLGVAAAEMLDEMVMGNVARLSSRRVPSQLIIRESLKVDNTVIKALQEEFVEQIVVDI